MLSRPAKVTLAFEGINGAGKSRIITELQQRLEIDPQNSVIIAKIAGLGNGRRFDVLRAILAEREEKLRRGTLSAKEIKDYHRNKLFRLAYRYQIRLFRRRQQQQFTHALLDRTPLMSPAYTSAAFPNNPHIREVATAAIRYTALLDIDFLFLFEILPAIVYGRILARNMKAHSRPLSEYTQYLDAPLPIVKEAGCVARSMLDDPNLTPKPFSIWDYMPYDQVQRQLHSYQSVIRHAAYVLGFRWKSIDGSGSVTAITDAILKTLEDCR